MTTPFASPRAFARGLVRTLTLLGEVGAAEVYRVQALRSRDPLTAGVLRTLQARDATHACEARARDRSPDAIRVAAEAAARAGGGLLGAVTSLGGDRAALAFDLALERLVRASYEADLALGVPAAERRVIAEILDDEREHRNLLRDRLGL